MKAFHSWIDEHAGHQITGQIAKVCRQVAVSYLP
jgi:hypothetical protein